VQDGSQIGMVKKLKDYKQLIMYNYQADKTDVYKVKGDFTKGTWKRLKKVI
jgi:hypothetical protein